ncbi:hypothetical protein TREMEDRAFT_33606 [Tremella mesenterica DSM 1558]|uniref:uncharacterized protein n=1 Tax=Tremella mesenterica (strain ATCC 24925 / CBS 8224 / DSM 1558 / NBRC 9311 / NRRL Y-6157 / RJB 2259-6 / UBC 559-6) TaxID=578456 RepID=UPI0003F496F6|nr:uncharacterized protein TREMEDRAFT_33606 [Tremella mesenterica DSM 1558]EIW67259.1 hypothetical protein TREMEDRAFT_33606 [Tremella mesenterica DSM 1558]
MASTPRRSTRSGAIFTPSPSSHPRSESHTTYSWTSAPRHVSSNPASSSSTTLSQKAEIDYTSFARIVSRQSTKRPLTPGRKTHAGKADEESRFTLGDGVAVSVEGGGEGVGVLVRLWETSKKAKGEEDMSGEGSAEDEERDEEEEEGSGERMWAEVHWCFRRQDLPGIMKNLSVEDNEVLLAASPIRPSSTSLPISLLLRTIPIYSRNFFRDQFAPSKSSVKGWTYVRQGVYWCNRAFDKGAKGGKVWKVDMDSWRSRGKAGQGWVVPTESVESDNEESEAETVDSSDDDGVFDGEKEESEDEGHEDLPEEGSAEEGQVSEKSGTKRSKRKEDIRKVKRPKLSNSKARKETELKEEKGKEKRKRKGKNSHPQISTSELPSAVPSLDELPTDPYQRAMRLLHVGATPDSLPCREEEFVEVLSKVEEGVESGGGGCLYIAGVPGTGKTATVHAVVKELKRKAEDGELPPFSYVEINGLKIPTPQHAYTVLWEAISGAKGASAKTALRGLEAHYARKTGGARGPRGHTFVVLMDELDQLLTAKQDVVYNFFNWPTMRDSQMFVVAVANRMDLPQHLAAKIKSRLGLQTLLFQPYDRQSLIEIVQSRLIPHPKSQEDHRVLVPDAIALAATKMAGTNGDARRVLDACRRAVEVAYESPSPHPVTAKEMMAVLHQMSSSPAAMYIKQCSEQQRIMLAAMVRCVRREGVPEVAWKNVRTDHDALTRSLLESDALLSSSELSLIFSSLVSTHALTWAYDPHRSPDERKVALGMDISEVGRVLMNEGEGWRRALAGT